MVFDRDRAIVGGVASYLRRHKDDDQFWGDLIRKNLKPKLKSLDPLLLVESFEQKFDFKKILENEHMDQINKILEGNEDLIADLKENARLKMGMFEWSWIEEWWKKDHPELLSIIMNHPESEKFKTYITNGVKNLSDSITNSL